MATYAISDLHGRMDLLREVLSFLKLDDKVYCLGDCGDRGPDSWEVIKTIASDKRFIYMKGNHEDLLYWAIHDYVHHDCCRDHAFWLLIQNGGLGTFESWQEDGEKAGWLSYLNHLPEHLVYTNKDGIEIHLTHAGFTPTRKDMDLTGKDLLWDRDHVFNRFEDFTKDIVIVHGHTPIPHIERDLRLVNEEFEPWEHGAFWYCNGHKCCIDTGAYRKGETVLLDLDTFDEHIFQVENPELIF